MTRLRTALVAALFPFFTTAALAQTAPSDFTNSGQTNSGQTNSGQTNSGQTNSGQTNSGMSGTGLQLLGAGDLLGEFGASHPETRPHLFGVREIEVGVFAPIDYLFDGVLILAAHDEGGEKTAEVHEAYISSSKLVRNVRMRAGYYFLNLGRLNSFHRHDWPFTSAPPTHERFFAKEAVTDGGAEISWLVPFLPFYLDLTAGVASGYNFGHAHSRGPAPIIPTHYFRALHYFSAGEQGGVQLGLNYVGRRTAEAGPMSLLGLELAAKVRELSQLRWVIHSELWYRAASQKELGGFAYVGYGLPDSRMELGLRLDGYTDLGLETAGGSAIQNLQFGFVPQLTFRSSEFMQLRASLETRFQTLAGTTSLEERLLQLQATFLIGAHPAHEF